MWRRLSSSSTTSTRVALAIRRTVSDLLHPYRESRAHFRVDDLEIAFHRLHQRAGDGETEARPLTRRFRGEERIEDLLALPLRNARPGVLHQQRHLFVVADLRYGDPLRLRLCHRLGGVEQQVDQYLIET